MQRPRLRVPAAQECCWTSTLPSSGRKKGEKVNLPRNGEKVISCVEGPGGGSLEGGPQSGYRRGLTQTREQVQRADWLRRGSGTVVVPQGEANKKEIVGTLSADMPIAYNVVVAVVVVMAESMCMNCSLHRGVDTSESE